MRLRFAISMVLCASGYAHAEAPLVSLRASHEGELERGRSAMLSLVVQPAPGHTLLGSGPLLVELEGSAIDPARRSLRRRDAIDPRAEAPRFEVEVRPHAKGEPSLSAHLVAWICRGRRCRPVEQQVPIPLTIAAPGARPTGRAIPDKP